MRTSRGFCHFINRLLSQSDTDSNDLTTSATMVKNRVQQESTVASTDLGRVQPTNPEASDDDRDADNAWLRKESKQEGLDLGYHRGTVSTCRELLEQLDAWSRPVESFKHTERGRGYSDALSTVRDYVQSQLPSANEEVECLIVDPNPSRWENNESGVVDDDSPQHSNASRAYPTRAFNPTENSTKGSINPKKSKKLKKSKAPSDDVDGDEGACTVEFHGATSRLIVIR